MEAGTIREGYELWRPNREKASSKQTQALVIFLLLVSGALCLIVTIGGWSRLQGGAFVCIFYIFNFFLYAFLIARWNRGVLPVTAALSIILIIFAAVATPAWFDRAKDGFSNPLLPSELLGLLTGIMIPVQAILIVVAMVAFNQNWQVEEERPIGGGPPPEVDDLPPEPEPA